MAWKYPAESNIIFMSCEHWCTSSPHLHPTSASMGQIHRFESGNVARSISPKSSPLCGCGWSMRSTALILTLKLFLALFYAFATRSTRGENCLKVGDLGIDQTCVMSGNEGQELLNLQFSCQCLLLQLIWPRSQCAGFGKKFLGWVASRS